MTELAGLLTPEEMQVLVALRKRRAEAEDPRKAATDALDRLAKLHAAEHGIGIPQAMVKVLETDIGEQLYAVYKGAREIADAPVLLESLKKIGR